MEKNNIGFRGGYGQSDGRALYQTLRMRGASGGAMPCQYVTKIISLYIDHEFDAGRWHRRESRIDTMCQMTP
jgi:hypothetical protein